MSQQNRPPRVFISYSHDSEPHRTWVLQLANRLRADGVDAWIDQYEQSPAEGWPRWMQRQMEQADFVLVICTTTYRRRFEGQEEPGKGKGATWEGLLAMQLIYDAGSLNRKVVPIIPAADSQSAIPTALRPFTSFRLPDDYDGLYRLLTAQPEVSAPAVGERKDLPSLPQSSSRSAGLPSPEADPATLHDLVQEISKLAQAVQRTGKMRSQPGEGLRRIAETLGEWLTSYVDDFILLLTRPQAAIGAHFGREVPRKKRMQRALVYALSTILLGICFARFVGLPNSPSEASPTTALAVLVVWILSAVTLHPVLRLFRARGRLEDTIVVFLVVISTVHLIFIPTLTIAGYCLTETKVTLTYDYIIYFGATDRGLWEETDRARAFDPIRQLVGSRQESFIKEEEPQRDKTIIPPLAEYDDDLVPQRPEERDRVSPSAVAGKRPRRSEEPVVRASLFGFLLAFWIVYYLTNSAYLAAGLSVVHQRSPLLLFFLALTGPIVAGLIGAVMLVLVGLAVALLA